jgi:high-affinity iron transporter
MAASYLLGLREGLEAALIVGVALGALRKTRRADLAPIAWAGVAGAVALSLALGATLNAIGADLEGPSEAVFEGLTMLLAAGVITWMIFWMRRQGRTVQAGLEANIQRFAGAGQRGGLFALTFVSVLREGVEMSLFLTAAVFATGAREALLGAGLGLLSAVAIGAAISAATLRLDLGRFFTRTGVLLLLFAAGFVARSVHELNELRWIPAVVDHVWDLNGVLSDRSGVGQVLGILFGYNGQPSLTEAVAYLAYLVSILSLLLRRRPGPAAQEA